MKFGCKCTNLVLLFYHFPYRNHIAVVYQFDKVNAGGVTGKVNLGSFARDGYNL